MKRISFCLGLMMLAGVLASCQKSGGNLPPPDGSTRVCIGASIHPGLKTRATSLSVPEGFAIRYIIEVWDTEEVIYRTETLPAEEEEVTFDFDLEETGQYTAILWADFIPEHAEQTNVTAPNEYVHYADMYYRTDSEQGLREIAIREESYRINHESRDAFYATIRIDKEESMFESSATLVRPFGLVSINEKETALLENVSEVHYTYQVPAGFNTIEGIPTTHSLAVKADCPPAGDGWANLFYDYIFASSMGDMLTHDFTMSFTAADGNKNFKEYVIPANCLPIARNKRTIANGTLLTTAKPDVPIDTKANISVTITPLWSESTPQDLPQQSGGDLPYFNNQGNPFETIP